MKKLHIALLVMVAGAIAVLLSFLKSSSTYDTIETAMSKPGRYVHLMAKLDKSQPIVYDPVKDPNFLVFTALDSTGRSVRVIYRNAKPENLEISEKLVLKGKYNDDYFHCTEIQTKCPSKYKEDVASGSSNNNQHSDHIPLSGKKSSVTK